MVHDSIRRYTQSVVTRMGEHWDVEEWEEPTVLDSSITGVEERGLPSNALPLQGAMSQLSSGKSSVPIPLPVQISLPVTGDEPSSVSVSTPGRSRMIGGKTKAIWPLLNTSSVKKETQQPLEAASSARDWETTPTANAPSPRLQRICPICFPPTPPKPYKM